MTDKKTTPTDEDRRIARKWAESVSPDINGSSTAISIARVILDTVPALPTLADMSHVARRETRWMRCDVDGEDGEWLIIDPFDDESHANVIGRKGYRRIFPTHHVIPRPDLARMEWTGSKKTAPALPDGWRLADHETYGRVVVTNTTPDSDGYVRFVLPDDGDYMGFDWHFCHHDKLTYIDTEPEADQ